MAEGNIEVVLRVFDAINRCDVEGALAEMAPDVVVDFAASESPYQGVYEGRDAAGRFLREWIGSWEEVSWTAEDVEEVTPGRVVLVNRARGRGAGSGIEIEARGANVWEVGDGLVRRMQLHADLAQARAAAGEPDPD